MLDQLIRGFTDTARGSRVVLAHPKLWKWLAAPFVIAAGLLIAFIWMLWRWLPPLMDRLVAGLPDWLHFLSGAFQLLLLPLLLAGAYVIYLSVAALLSAPFNEILSEEIEEIITGQAGPPFSTTAFLRDLVLGVIHAARRLVIYLATMTALFLAGVLIPVIGTAIATAAGLWITARFAAYDAYDAVWARKGWNYGAKTRYLAQKRARTTGLGAAVALLMAVPLANLLALSVGAAGATLAFLDASDTHHNQQ